MLSLEQKGKTRAHILTLGPDIKLYFSHETCIAFKIGSYGAQRFGPFSRTTSQHVKLLEVNEFPIQRDSVFQITLNTLLKLAISNLKASQLTDPPKPEKPVS